MCYEKRTSLRATDMARLAATPAERMRVPFSLLFTKGAKYRITPFWTLLTRSRMLRLEEECLTVTPRGRRSRASAAVLLLLPTGMRRHRKHTIGFRLERPGPCIKGGSDGR